jgi:stage II sporulation protein D
MKRLPLILLLLLLTTGARAGDTTVRVSIFSIFKPTHVQVSSKRPLLLTAVAEDGNIGKYKSRSVQIICGTRTPLSMDTGKNVVLAGSAQFRPALGRTLTVGVKDRPHREYSGWIEIRERQGLCLIINHVSLEDYSRDVACRELGASLPEALKAQAVAVRSYALATANKHGLEGFDFCDLTHCQAYTGRDACSAEQRKQLEAVSGLALMYKNRPATTYYFSTCGGHTASAADVFGPGADQPYLRGVKDAEGEKPPYCARSDHMVWRMDVGRRNLCALLDAALPTRHGDDCGIGIVETGKGGWVRRIDIHGNQLNGMNGEQFHNFMGRSFGWGEFKSGNFTMEFKDDRYMFLGRGLGHGVGMCQHGAMGMARADKDYKAILKHYYPGTELKLWP